MTHTLEVCPAIEDHHHRMVAQLLACCERDPQRRRDHRLAMLERFPAADRDAVKTAFNQVLKARNQAKERTR